MMPAVLLVWVKQHPSTSCATLVKGIATTMAPEKSGALPIDLEARIKVSSLIYGFYMHATYPIWIM